MFYICLIVTDCYLRPECPCSLELKAKRGLVRIVRVTHQKQAFKPNSEADRQMVGFQLGQQYKADHLSINKGSALPFIVSTNHSPGKSSKLHLKCWRNITSDFAEFCIRQKDILDIFFLYTEIYCCVSDICLVPYTFKS